MLLREISDWSILGFVRPRSAGFSDASEKLTIRQLEATSIAGQEQCRAWFGGILLGRPGHAGLQRGAEIRTNGLRARLLGLLFADRDQCRRAIDIGQVLGCRIGRVCGNDTRRAAGAGIAVGQVRRVWPAFRLRRASNHDFTANFNFILSSRTHESRMTISVSSVTAGGHSLRCAGTTSRPAFHQHVHYGLITAENVHDIAIVGEGVIDGNRTKRGGPKTVAIPQTSLSASLEKSVGH